MAPRGISQEKPARDEPNRPRRNADSPRAFFDKQMVNLRVIRNDHQCCSDPAQDFHLRKIAKPPRHCGRLHICYPPFEIWGGQFSAPLSGPAPKDETTPIRLMELSPLHFATINFRQLGRCERLMFHRLPQARSPNFFSSRAQPTTCRLLPPTWSARDPDSPNRSTLNQRPESPPDPWLVWLTRLLKNFCQGAQRTRSASPLPRGECKDPISRRRISQKARARRGGSFSEKRILPRPLRNCSRGSPDP